MQQPGTSEDEQKSSLAVTQKNTDLWCQQGMKHTDLPGSKDTGGAFEERQSEGNWIPKLSLHA